MFQPIIIPNWNYHLVNSCLHTNWLAITDRRYSRTISLQHLYNLSLSQILCRYLRASNERPYGFAKQKSIKKRPPYWVDTLYVGISLFFRAVTSQVFSAPLSLTSVFGMGTGGPSASSTPTILLYSKAFQLFYLLVTRAGIEPALPAWEAGVLTAWPTSLVFRHKG